MAIQHVSSSGMDVKRPDLKHVAVKEAVMPFARFPGVDPVLGPEMRSTGEVMGIDTSFESAFAKSQLAAGVNLPRKGSIFISLKESDKPLMLEAARAYADLGFEILATRGTAKTFEAAGIKVKTVNKVYEGRPDVTDTMKDGGVQLVINTTEGATLSKTCICRRSSRSRGSLPTTISPGPLASAATANASPNIKIAPEVRRTRHSDLPRQRL